MKSCKRLRHTIIQRQRKGPSLRLVVVRLV
jgi:hypothetical protein